MSTSSPNGSGAGVPTPPTQAQIDQLLQLGIMVESLTFPDTKMREAIPMVLATPEIMKNLTAALESRVPNFKQNLEALAALFDILSHDNATVGYSTGLTIMSFVALVAVILRVWTRRRVTGKIWADDWFAMATMVGSLALFSEYMVATSTAAARHVWNVTFHDLQHMLMTTTIAEILFILILVPAKFTFLIFYYRLGPETWYRGCIIALGFAIIAMTIAGEFFTIFQCKPIAFWKDPVNAKCIDRVKAYSIYGYLTVATDIIILLLPIWKIASLNLRSKKEKIVVIIMFAAGGLICIANVLRVITLNKVLTSPDVTMAVVEPGIWSLLELNLAIVISSVPAFRHLLHSNNVSRLRQRIFMCIWRPRGVPHEPHKSVASSSKSSAAASQRGRHTTSHPRHGTSIPVPSNNTGIRSFMSIFTRTTATISTTMSHGLSRYDEMDTMDEESRPGGLTAPRHNSYAPKEMRVFERSREEPPSPR